MRSEFPSAVPEIPVKNLSEALTYYQDNLGFTIDWSDEDLGLAGISKGHCRMFLANHDFRKAHGNVGPILNWLNADSKEEVDELYRAWSSSRAKLLSEPDSKPWGLHEFTAADPDGNLFRVFYDFATPARESALATPLTSVPSGTELVRPFMPARDFELSKRFYEALGFEKVFDGEVAIFNAGSGGFILQRYFQEDWAGNFMMHLMVDDLDLWWAHIESLDLATGFGVPSPKPPAVQPWGLRVAYVVDPSGVLWHVAQR